MDFFVTILDPTPDCPAHSIADEHIVADFDDANAIRKLANQSDVTTYEFEHIGVDTLIQLEEEGYTIYPTAQSLKIIQNKLTQKQTLRENDITVPDFAGVNSPNDIKKLAERYGYPLLLKSCYGGYDGKGNRVIVDKNDVETGYGDLGGSNRILMIEEFIDYRCEISVIAARDTSGNITTFPIAENQHQDNILLKTTVPASITAEEEAQAQKVASQVLEVFNGVGIFCIEMFVTRDGKILVNEIAPRPHNSGHYTIEACITSQFEQHVRAITSLPLGATDLLSPAVMTNILGDRGPQPACYHGIKEAMALTGVNPHIYGKTLVKPGRKMGHITTVGADKAIMDQNADKASQLIGFDD